MCCRSCQTCLILRNRQKENGVLNADDKATKKKKRLGYKIAEKELMAHLNDLSVPNHALYSEEHLFPEGKLIWKDGKYEELDEEEAKTEEELTFLNELHDGTADFNENHHVGTKARVRRDGQGKYKRPAFIEVGQIVVYRLDNVAEGQLKWSVGEVMAVEEERIFLTVCEYSSTNIRKDAITREIKWAAQFRGVEMSKDKKSKGRKQTSAMKELDEFHLTASCKPTTKNLKPVLTRIEETAVAEYDDREVIFKSLEAKRKSTSTRTASTAKGRKLKAWVFDVLQANPKVDWNGEKRVLVD
jgi:hypothetical protein